MKITIGVAEAAQKLYRYAMVNRPVGIGCCPKDHVAIEDRPAPGKDHYEYARHGIVVYERKLTDAETKQFEMAQVVDGAERIPFAKHIASELRRYAKQYIDQSINDPVEFVSNVKERLRSGATGYPPSVGNIDSFAELVVKELRNGLI